MEPCIDPTAVTSEQRAAYAVDPTDVPAEVAQHIAACPACAQEVQGLRSLMGHLSRDVYRIDCPSSEELTSFAAGALAVAQRATVEMHLPTCARCREELDLVRLALADRDPILNWTVPPTAPGGLRRILAALADALAPGAPTAVPALNLRGASSVTRPHVYRAEDVTISVRVTTAPQGRVTVEGLLTSDADPVLMLAELPVRLYAHTADAPPHLVAEETSDAGTFMLGPVAAGRFTLEIHLPDRIIAIENLAE